MKMHTKESGFTAVELLITLFIASIFLIAGFQLYAVVIKDNGTTRAQVTASNVAYSYIREYTTSASNPCVPITTPYTQTPNVSGLTAVTVSMTASCPYSGFATTGTGSVPTATQHAITEINVTVTYNNPQQTITNAIYVTK
jgi:prepilin-type N-terminal cleavage/methylation domain-containing protein